MVLLQGSVIVPWGIEIISGMWQIGFGQLDSLWTELSFSGHLEFIDFNKFNWRCLLINKNKNKNRIFYNKKRRIIDN